MSAPRHIHFLLWMRNERTRHTIQPFWPFIWYINAYEKYARICKMAEIASRATSEYSDDWHEVMFGTYSPIGSTCTSAPETCKYVRICTHHRVTYYKLYNVYRHLRCSNERQRSNVRTRALIIQRVPYTTWSEINEQKWDKYEICVPLILFNQFENVSSVGRTALVHSIYCAMRRIIFVRFSVMFVCVHHY